MIIKYVHLKIFYILKCKYTFKMYMNTRKRAKKIQTFISLHHSTGQEDVVLTRRVRGKQ